MANRAILVADLGFGDAGKGSVVDYLSRQPLSTIVIRYNGGPQAGHNVHTHDGRHHTFSQFGSGSFVPGVRTHISRFMLINPFNAFAEANHLFQLGLHDIWNRTTFDGEAMVITPFHRAANRLRELTRGEGRHGSTGEGVGETRALDIAQPDLTIRLKDIYNVNVLHRKLRISQAQLSMQMKELTRDWPDNEEMRANLDLLKDPNWIVDCLQGYRQFKDIARIVDGHDLIGFAKTNEQLVFEGAQGVLLDEKYGFHPHTTWSNITFDNAMTLLKEIDHQNETVRMGLVRGYATRHGDGPFVTEDPVLTEDLPDTNNVNNHWQREFRVGQPDLVSTKYAIDVVGGIDELVVSCLDRMIGRLQWRLADGYRLNSDGLDDLFDFDAEGIARRIRFKSAKDLERQTSITNALLKARPVYQELETASGQGILANKADIERYLNTLSQKLEHPINLISYGPTATAKCRRIPATL